VLIGGLPAARAGDTAACAGPPDAIVVGSFTVLIGNQPAARMGDITSHGGMITLGHPTTMIGDLGGTGGGASGATAMDDDPANPAAFDTDDEVAADGSAVASASEAVETEAEPEEAGEAIQDVGTGTHWLEIELVDEAEQPVVGEHYAVHLPYHRKVTGALDAKGQVHIKGIERPGWCRIEFPNLDLAAWERWTPTPTTPAGGGDAPMSPATQWGSGPVVGGNGKTKLGQWRAVRQGECISSIAKDTGHFWDTIWSYPLNKELKQRRADPNVLLPGDAVFIPGRRSREASGSTDQHHKFRRRGEPAMLRLRVLENGRARANEAYELDIDGRVFSGTTDAEGMLAHPIPPDARNARLIIGGGAIRDEYVLNLGQVDPVDELTGVQARLANLGYDCGPIDNRLGSQTKWAIEQFQANHQLAPTGEPDEATRQKLVEAYGV
jgi:uncharacterized Zn-binding protein involved in type VI secretion